MINNIMFITVLFYPDLLCKMSRVIVRDDREEMKAEVRRVIKVESDTFVVDTIAEHNFKKHVTKYYTVAEFLK